MWCPFCAKPHVDVVFDPNTGTYFRKVRFGPNQTARFSRETDTAKRLREQTGHWISMWCPFCGKPHVDRGEWAKRLHHKHLCHDDEHGKGCGKLFRIGEPGSPDYFFGEDRFRTAVVFDPNTGTYYPEIRLGRPFTRERITAGNLAVTFDDVREAWLSAARESSASERERLMLEADEQLLRLRASVLGPGVPRGGDGSP